jgi:SAM-dependent methyltransferase
MNPSPHPFDRNPTQDPAGLYRYRDGMSAVDLLVAATIHLGVFNRLASGPVPEASIPAEFDIHARPADVMISLLAALGLVERVDGLVRRTTLASEHFGPDAPWSLMPYYASMKDRPQVHDMLRVLRGGGQAMWAGEDAAAWAKAMEREDFARSFTAAMDSRGVLMGPRLARAVDFSGRTGLLDIAGGSGIFACAVKNQHPVLRCAVLEKSPVDEVTRRMVRERGFGDTVDVHTGDMFRDAWPAGFDVHLLSNVLHDWDTPEVLALLRRSHAALPPGGLLLVHDAFLHADKAGPLEVAEYSALLMQITEGKCYSTAELEEMLTACGFQPADFHPTAVHRSVITAVRI